MPSKYMGADWIWEKAEKLVSEARKRTRIHHGMSTTEYEKMVNDAGTPAKTTETKAPAKPAVREDAKEAAVKLGKAIQKTANTPDKPVRPEVRKVRDINDLIASAKTSRKVKEYTKKMSQQPRKKSNSVTSIRG